MPGSMLQAVCVMLLLWSAAARAQEARDTLEVPLRAGVVPVVLIRLEGDVRIAETTDSGVVVVSEVRRTGRVRGVSNARSRPTYRAEATWAGDTLVVADAERAPLWSIGLSTARERVSHVVSVPRGTQVVLERKESRHRR